MSKALIDVDTVERVKEAISQTLDDATEWDCNRSAVLEDMARAAIAALPPAVPDATPEHTITLDGIEGGDGFWSSCTGCHETNEGYETGYYPYSDTFKCYLGGGCRECGGLGAVWDNTDYEGLAEFLRQDEPTTPDPAESHVDGWRVRVIEWATDETVKVVQCKGEREAEKIERGMSMNMASEYYTEVDNKPRTITTTPDPVAEAAKVLLANMPNPVFDNLKPVLMGEFGVTVEGCDEDGEECHYIEPIGWSTIKDILLMAVRALTKDGEAG